MFWYYSGGEVALVLLVVDEALVLMGLLDTESIAEASEGAYMCCSFYSCIAACLALLWHREAATHFFHSTHRLALAVEADASPSVKVRSERGSLPGSLQNHLSRVILPWQDAHYCTTCFKICRCCSSVSSNS